MRAHWPLAFVAAAAIVLGGGAGAAVAADPIPLASARVLDQAGVLSAAEEQSVEQRLNALTSSGVDLWVVYVDQFTNPSDPEEWANQTASNNGLGPSQYLLAISTDGRQFYLSGDSSEPVSGDELTAIEQQRILPELRDENWAGAATAAADGLAAAVGGGSAAGGSILPIILIVVLLTLAALVIWLVVRSRRKAAATAGSSPAAPADELSQLSTEDLSRRAASALVHTDDAVKTSEQELGFAEAQFGAAAAAEFQQALAHAKNDLSQAFALQQQLDDDVPDSEADMRQWNAQILELCAHANQELDEKAAAFDELRDLEQNAPEALARVQALHGAVAAEQDAVAPRLAVLAQSYAPEALATVAGNPEQARELLAFSSEQLRTAQEAIGAGDGANAAVGIRAAESAVDEAKLLSDAVDTLAADLAQGDQDAARLLAELDTDLATASALPDPDSRLAPVIASTRQQVEAGRALLSGTARRPLFALEGLNTANAQIDALLEGVRDSQQKAQRASQQLGMLLTQAQGQVSAAEDFITSRRGAIGAQARTRLAEAGASLVQARQLEQSDPTQALSYAQRANDLAAQAIQYAQNDVGAFQGGMPGANSGSSGGGNMMNAVLGGILINSLLGGGGGGGGMFGGGGGRGGSPGSFGGGGTRGRRGGGRF